MQQYFRQFNKDKQFSAEQYEDNIKLLSMELNQLKRQNLFLRRKLDKTKIKPESQTNKRLTPKTNKTNDPLKQQLQEHPLNGLIQEINIIRETMKIIFVQANNIKSPKWVNQQDLKNISQQHLSENLELLLEQPAELRYIKILEILDQYHTSRNTLEIKIEEIILDVADYARRLNQVLIKKLTGIRKSYDRMTHKIRLFKMQYQQNRQQVAASLKSMNRIFQKSISEFHYEIPKTESNAEDKDKLILDLKKKIIKLEIQNKMLTNK